MGDGIWQGRERVVGIEGHGEGQLQDMGYDTGQEDWKLFQGRKEDASPKMRAVFFDRKFKG